MTDTNIADLALLSQLMPTQHHTQQNGPLYALYALMYCTTIVFMMMLIYTTRLSPAPLSVQYPIEPMTPTNPTYSTYSTNRMVQLNQFENFQGLIY